MDLKELRSEIDVIDDELVRLFGKRMDIAAQIADYKKENNLPILMVSAKQLPEDRKIGYRLGTNDFMTKPVDEEEMLLRIGALLRRSNIANEHKLTAGETVLDYDALTVSCKGEVQELPQKEFQLLSCAEVLVWVNADPCSLLKRIYLIYLVT